MRMPCLSIASGLMLAMIAAPSGAAVTGPYVADANTLHLYHFDETAGAGDPGNPLLDSGSGTAYDLTDTGGPDGRNNTGSGGYGAATYTGFGSAFNALDSGSGLFHSTASGIGGGAHGGSVDQADFQDADGTFTIEALINIANINTGASQEQTILSHDSGSTRGGIFQIIDGNLRIYNGRTGDNNAQAAIPTTGDHAFVANQWFHVAVTYNGDEAGSNNVTFYWTRVLDGVTVANAIGSDTIGGDFNATTMPLFIGGAGRSPYRYELKGSIDEVRISNVVRGADEFIFAAAEVPTPGALPAGLVLIGALLMRRRTR